MPPCLELRGAWELLQKSTSNLSLFVSSSWISDAGTWSAVILFISFNPAKKWIQVIKLGKRRSSRTSTGAPLVTSMPSHWSRRYGFNQPHLPLSGQLSRNQVSPINYLGLRTPVVRSPVSPVILYTLWARRSVDGFSSQCSGHPVRDNRLFFGTRPLKHSPRHSCISLVSDSIPFTPRSESKATSQAECQR